MKRGLKAAAIAVCGSLALGLAGKDVLGEIEPNGDNAPGISLRVLMAGRTLNTDERAFGIVVLLAPSEARAH